MATLLMEGLMPGACCGLSFALFSQGTPFWITGLLVLIVAGLVGFLSWSSRRYP